MGKQNITLALPEQLVREARHMAVEKGTSVSRLLADYLVRMLREDQDYEEAMERAMKRLRQGVDLGSDGEIRFRREDLHER